MYAIIRAGGHQEKVSVGEVITVDRLKQEPESTVTFVPLLVSDDSNVVTDRKELGDKAAVVGRVLEHVRGDKIDVFQYRNKTGYRRHIGHRSALTLVEISEIRLGDKKVTLADFAAANEEAAAAKAEASKAALEARDKAKQDRAKAKTEKKASAKSAPRAAAASKKAPAKKKAASPKKTAASRKK